MTIANGSPKFQNCEGEWGKQKLHVKDLMKQHPVVLHFTSWEQRGLACEKKGTNIVLGIE